MFGASESVLAPFLSSEVLIQNASPRIVGDESAMGVVPTACKNGAMGNRNLYHFCLVIIIIMDITVPLILCALAGLTFDGSNGTILNRTLCLPKSSERPSEPVVAAVRESNACCSVGVACSTLAICVGFFVMFTTIPSVLEPGTMAPSWYNQTFCNGYVSEHHSHPF